MAIDHEMIQYLTDRSVIIPDSCWLWVWFCSPDGYGQFFRRGKTYLAHRESMRAHGFDVEGLTVDHIDNVCPNKNCWNPAHLEVCTRSENTRRAARARHDRRLRVAGWKSAGLMAA